MFSPIIIATLLAAAAFQDPVPPAPQTPAPATCDAAGIKPESYRLAVEAQALNLTTPYHRWWDTYDLGARPTDAEDADDAAIAIAERALELDDRNLLAHAQLARQYLVAGLDASRAHEAWRRALDGGGAVAWLATLFDVDDRAYFVVAFDREGIRVYRFGQLAGAIRQERGVPVLPGPDREELWRALGGCVPEGLPPEATIPWSSVREIESGRFALWFELDSPVAIRSDRGRTKRLTRVMVNLHTAQHGPAIGYFFPGPPPPFAVRPSTVGPAAYQERVRGTLIELFDPEGRIRVPAQRRYGG
jgi:hypothetical protein